METRPGEGVMKEERFPQGRFVGRFGISEDNITGREKKRNEAHLLNSKRND